MKRLLIIITGVFIISLFAANHLAYNKTKEDFNTFLSTYNDVGIDIKYDVDYNIVFNYIFRQKVFLNNVEINTPVLDKAIKISRIGSGNLDLKNLNVQLSVVDLKLPVSTLVNENANPVIENYLQAVQSIGINKRSILTINLNTDLTEKDNLLSGHLLVDIEGVASALLDIRVDNFETDKFHTIWNTNVETMDEQIQKQVLINQAYEDLDFQKIVFELNNKGLANAILDHTQKMGGFETQAEAQTAIITELENMIANENTSDVMKVFFNEFINFLDV